MQLISPTSICHTIYIVTQTFTCFYKPHFIADKNKISS
ncbi:hypothetical protein EBCG_01865 [Escherichia marmotae]|nr:hypothetical protein EBCG_01865 [Escherichia marmotae]